MAHQNESGQILDPTDERWIAFVDSAPTANIFHHPAWINLIAECYGFRPFVIVISDENGEINAGLPIMEINSSLTGRRWVSLPFTDHCHPLYKDDTPQLKLFEFLSYLQIENNIPRIELRSAIPYDVQVHKDNSQVLHLLRLSADTKSVYRTFHRTRTRYSIAKAERAGVRVQWAENMRDLDIFYDLQMKTRHRLGVPVQPKRYFELLWRRIIETDLGFILLAYKDSVPISGGVFLIYKFTLVAKYGASDRSFFKYSPNHALYWSSIRWGCEHGYNTFDWGRSAVNNIGLRNFKNGWGAQESDLTYSVFSDNPPNHIIDRLSGAMGSFIRHSPRWVCRLTGELLYKHFA
jgi:hypothetical protein